MTDKTPTLSLIRCKVGDGTGWRYDGIIPPELKVTSFSTSEAGILYAEAKGFKVEVKD